MLILEEKKKQRGKVFLSPQSGLYIFISIQKFCVRACIFNLLSPYGNSALFAEHSSSPYRLLDDSEVKQLPLFTYWESVQYFSFVLEAKLTSAACIFSLPPVDLFHRRIWWGFITLLFQSTRGSVFLQGRLLCDASSE